MLAEHVGYKTTVHRYSPQAKGIDERDFQEVNDCYQIRFYDLDTKQDTPTRPTLIEHEGVTYMARKIQTVEAVPYDGHVVNLTVEGSPTFQTSVGMSHNTVKPVDLIQWLFERLSDEGDTVLDPFAGSGTAGIAAVETNRNLQMVELDETGNYEMIIKARVEEAIRESVNGRLLWEDAVDVTFNVDE